MSSGATPRHTPVVVIGAGQAGLAMSRCLTDRAIDHVVLERSTVAHSWRAERWDSLRLLSPNWLARLPGLGYDGDDPDGYMTAAEVVDRLDRYRSSFDAPVQTATPVSGVAVAARGSTLSTPHGPWTTRAVVVATGAASRPRVPALALDLPRRVRQLTSSAYRNPDQIARGRVLVVGASASGVQIADELRRAGRDVVLSVGEHVRVPRTYRGMDIHWWLHALGLLDERTDPARDGAPRRVPSLQLIGSDERRAVDLGALGAAGVELVGRLVAVRGRSALFSGGLAHLCRAADLRQQRLLDRIDRFARAEGLDAEVGEPDRPEPTRVPTPATRLDLAGVGTVVWATGFRLDHRWLDGRLLGPGGVLRHSGGVGPAPGAFALGLPFMRRRSSTFLAGAGADARELAPLVAGHLDRKAARC